MTHIKTKRTLVVYSQQCSTEPLLHVVGGSLRTWTYKIRIIQYNEQLVTTQYYATYQRVRDDEKGKSKGNERLESKHLGH